MECDRIEKQKLAKFQVVQGNVLKIAIPLTLRTVTVENNELVSTDSDFIPSRDYPVNVEFCYNKSKVAFEATMRDGNVAYVEDNGTIPAGTYALTVSCKDDLGRSYRFKQRAVVDVVDVTADAGIKTPIEYEVSTHYLDAAIFLALKGDDGVGINDIITEPNAEAGGANIVTIVLTDGRTRSFSVMNGAGSVDSLLDPSSPRPIANSAVALKFTELESRLNNLFGDVDYDSTSRTIRFFAKGKPKTAENVIASLDARPFVKDSAVNDVYISNNQLVIAFNSDGGYRTISLPLSQIFNASNYYNRSQIDNLLSNFYPRSTVDEMLDQLFGVSSVDNRFDYSKLPHVVLDGINHSYNALTPLPYNSPLAGKTYHTTDNRIVYYYQVEHQGVNPAHTDALLRNIDEGLIYYNKDDQKFYRFDSSSGMTVISVGGSESEGSQAIYSNGTIMLSGSGSHQPVYSNGTITI